MTISDTVFAWCVREQVFTDRERFDEFVSGAVEKGNAPEAALAVKCHGRITEKSLEYIEEGIKAVIERHKREN